MAAFQIFLSIFFFGFFFLPQIASSATNCKPSSCDGTKNLQVKFPFQLNGSQAEACGCDPWFDLSCNNQNQTILTLPPSGDFVVVEIPCLVQWVNSSDPEQCIFRRFWCSFILSGSPFQLGQYPPCDLHLINNIFYNCSSNVTHTHSRYWPIDCLGSDDYKILIARPGYHNDSPPPASCREIETVLSPICYQRCEESGGDCARQNATSLAVRCYESRSPTPSSRQTVLIHAN